MSQLNASRYIAKAAKEEKTDMSKYDPEEMTALFSRAATFWAAIYARASLMHRHDGRALLMPWKPRLRLTAATRRM